jgi:hypothetical protein
MLRDIYRTRLCDRVPAAALLALTLAAAGCTGGGFGGAAAPPAASASASPPPAGSASAVPPPAPNLKDKIESFFTKSATTEPRPTTANLQPDIDCPLIDIREGASTLTIPPPPPDGSNEAMSLKYQGIFVRAARDCKVANNQLVLRLGVQGRVIVGPAGGPGQVEVPLRIAVVDQSPTNTRTIVTKLIRIPVTVGNDDNANFTHIEDGLSFPLPSSSALDNYVIYIGFDPLGAAAEDKAKLKPAPKIKPRPKPNPTAPTG